MIERSKISVVFKHVQIHLPILVERTKPKKPNERIEIELLVLDRSAGNSPTSSTTKPEKKGQEKLRLHFSKQYV